MDINHASSFPPISPNPTIRSTTSSSVQEGSRTPEDGEIVSSSASLVTTSATSVTLATLPQDVTSIGEFTDAIRARLDALPRDIFLPFDLADETAPKDMPIGVVVPRDETLPGADPTQSQYRVIGPVGDVIGAILVGAGGWSADDYRQWVFVRPHQNPETFKPAKQAVDAAVAWARKDLPEDVGRTAARSVAEAILEGDATLRTVAEWNNYVLSARITREIDPTNTAQKLISSLMEPVCLHPTSEARVDRKGAKLSTYIVELGISLGGTAPIERFTVPGMMIVSTAVSGADNRKTKSAVLYCAGMEKSFTARAFGGMETSMTDFMRRPETKPLSAFPGSTLSLGEMLPFYLKLMVPDFSASSDKIVCADLVPYDDDIFRKMATDAGHVISGATRTGAPTAQDFASEKRLRDLWRDWLGRPATNP